MRGLWLLLVLVAAAKAEKVFIGDQVIRVNAESEEHIQLLQALETQEEWEVDFWLDPVSTELPVDIRVPRSSLSAVTEYLSSYNIPYSVIINNLQVCNPANAVRLSIYYVNLYLYFSGFKNVCHLQDLLDEEKAEMQMSQMKERSTRSFNFGAYHRLETIYSWMDTLVAQHPNLVTKQEIGRSYENRPMYVLKFSTGGYKRPAIWIDTGIHSREWVSQATGVWTANKIATDFGTDASLTSLLNTMDIYMLLLANPDGYAYTHSNNRMWRKTRSKNSGSSCRGVDPNRNWDAGFGGPGASRNPCSDSYHGPSAHSEIEVKNVVNLIKNHGNFKSFISVHAYSQLLMYPYGYNCKDVSHQPELDSVGRAAVQKLSSLYGTRYKVGSICKIIYQASGGSIDWSYNLGIKYSYAFELRDTGRYGFILPANQIIPTASETWLALKHIMEYVHDHPY
ncbi:Carboxypeptidase A2 [Collichthys lucidus]|uniref:Carboxypeptidase A2 n=1 Tax=Collichthys lucidus TaxID=240159 RepID=A0A4U5UI59_COLLU|nr:Carboxypeptidase A2 [Collichthys lucidus]